MAKGDLTKQHIERFEAALDALTSHHMEACKINPPMPNNVQTCDCRFGKSYRFLHKQLIECQLKYHRYLKS